MADEPFFQQVQLQTIVNSRDVLSTGQVINRTSTLPNTPVLEYRRWNLFPGAKTVGSAFRKPTVYNSFYFRSKLHPYDFNVKAGVGLTIDRQYWGTRSPNPVPFFRYGTTGTIGKRIPIVDSNTVNRAITQALAKGSRQEINIAVALAETRKSVSMIVERTWRAAAALRLIRKGKFKEAAWAFGLGSVQRNGKTYLEWSYGWKPLIQDLQGLFELFRDGLDDRPYFHVTSSVTHDYANPISSTWVSEGSWYQGAFVRLDYRFDDSYIDSMSQLGLLNPWVVGWELVPFSFVVDWFIPIGTFLEALSASAGLKFVSGSITKKNWGKVVAIRNTPAGTVFVGGKRESLTYQGKAIERTTFGSEPAAKLYYRAPFTSINKDGDTSLSAQRMANAIALIAALKGKR